ncbi:MAG TPA: pyruvate formate lyase family protein [Bacteroidales bacterium]|nr:pyruvate formate lyase family protein [Bacteroidales bacterium]
MDNQSIPLVRREITGKPSGNRSKFFKQRYLESPLMVDIEYIRHLTAAYRQTDGMETLERRATCHARALANLTPVIHAQDTLAGNKTRFIRGAIPYANYAAEPFLKEMRKEEQDAQSKHAEQGSGGGIGTARAVAEEQGLRLVSGKFLISSSDYDEFREICEYWEEKSFQAQGDRLWKTHFEGADFIRDGWKIGLYTAPHEPCPEGRLILDYETALNKGYDTIISETEARIKAFRPGQSSGHSPLRFWKAALTVLKGALQFAKNYASEATRMAGREKDPARKAELREIAETCLRVPAEPPRNFREAIQSFWFTYLLGHIEGSHLGYSPGRLDMVLRPWYENDPTMTLGQAIPLFEELFVKMTQIEYIASLSWQGLGHGNLYQNLILGGSDENGNPASSEVSMAILHAQINVQMTQPTLSVWWDDRLEPNFLMKAAECVKTGVGYPAFFNQSTYLRHEMATSGLPAELIRKHCAIGGCTEPTLQGMAYGIVQAGFINHGKLIDLVVNGGVDPETGIRMFEARRLNSYEEIRQYYLDLMNIAVRNWQRYWNWAMIAHRETVPLIFCSVFVNDCLGRGKCMDDGGAVLNHSVTTLSSGLVNVTNSLAVVRRLCFDEKVCTPGELFEAVRNNWQDHDALRRKALDIPHWGNDDDSVDEIFLDLFNEYCHCVRAERNYLGEPYDPSMLAISTPVPFGRVCGAFPDGRLKGEPLADGVTSPFPGTDTQGPTAVIRSSSKVDHTRIRGGLLNLKFHPTALKGETGSKNLLALIKTYFESPGFQVQFNVVDSRMLRDAQEHPENYRDLVVRVAGFSAYWVEMSKALQDQVIWRTEHNL